MGTRGLWGRVAGLVGRHPRRTWVVTLLALLVLGGFVPTFRAEGITQSQLFLNKVSRSPARRCSPATSRPAPAARSRSSSPRAGPTQVVATLTQGQGRLRGRRHLQPARRARGAAEGRRRQGPGPGHPAPGRGQPGGRGRGHPPAQRARRRSARTCWSAAARRPTWTSELASERDLRVIIPAILLVILLVLMLLLRSVVAPVLLVLANVVSFAATLGVSRPGVQPRLRLPGLRPVDAAVRVRVPRRAGHRLLDLPDDPRPRGVDHPDHAAGHPRRRWPSPAG